MCWSGEASAALATAGLASTAYVAYKGEKKDLWIPLGFFSLMELLQAFTYAYIGQCDAPMNQILTVLGYLHIAFQPFFINAISLHFIPDYIREKIAPWVYTICFAGTILLLLKLYPFQLVGGWGAMCIEGKEGLCGPNLCSYHGIWHIAWSIPINSLTSYTIGYFIAAFLVPLLYGSWRFTLYHVLMGPFLAYLLTSDKNEWAAVWCLLSIGFMLIAFKTPIRKYIYVKKWYFWNYPVSKKHRLNEDFIKDGGRK